MQINLKVDKSVTSSFLSKLTSGFSGAEIENLVNHAIIDTVDKHSQKTDKINEKVLGFKDEVLPSSIEEATIDEESFEEARDRVLTGIKIKMPKDKMRNLTQTAVYESGKILTCFLDPLCKDDIHKVSIATRGSSRSKSYKLQNDHFQGTKEQMISMIDFSLGGIFAEEIYFSSIEKIGTDGGGDLQKATNIAKSMIKEY